MGDVAVLEDQQDRDGLRGCAHAGRVGEPVARRAGLDRGLVVGEVAADRGDGEDVGDPHPRMRAIVAADFSPEPVSTVTVVSWGSIDSRGSAAITIAPVGSV